MALNPIFQLSEKILDLAGQLHNEVVEIRRTIHQWPELSFEEVRTARKVSEFLNQRGIKNVTGIAKTGVVATIEGKNPAGRIIALRADMDALPISEENEIPYKSQRPGKMHACGHDVHTASLLGTAAILNELKEHFDGRVKLIFQPSEEKYPGGASVMIREGVLENPAPEAIFGQHVFPELETGKVGFRAGRYMASTDEIFLTVKGKGGHGALPHRNNDPVLASAHILSALQQVVSRNTDPALPAVVSFGKVIANGQTNVIPDKVEMAGIMRTFDEEWRKEMKILITRIAQKTAEAFGTHCTVRFDEGYPVLINDEILTGRARANAAILLGNENVTELDLRTTAEDFAFFAQKIPGCFYRLGTGNKSKGIVSNLHTPTFDVDEESLRTGMALMAWLTICELKGFTAQ
ncbi:MAG: M20 family metallopeptidase [Bacteroidales bacterium]